MWGRVRADEVRKGWDLTGSGVRVSSCGETGDMKTRPRRRRRAPLPNLVRHPAVHKRGRLMSRRPRIAARALGAWCTMAAVVAVGVIGVAGGPPVHGQVVRFRGMAAAEGSEGKQDGFSVRKEAGKFNDALEDFARYRDKRAWELAFRSLEQLPETKMDGMVSAGNGFFVPSRVLMMQG